MRRAWFTAPLILAVTASSVLGQEQSSAKVYGLLIDATGGQPVAEVRISLSPGTITATSGPNGRFALLDIPFGRYTIRFDRLGYVTRVDTMRVGPGNPIEITVRLATSPVAVDPIHVVVRSTVLEQAGFYERRDLGPHGTFFTQEDIQRFAPVALSDLMRQVQSTILVSGGPGRTMVRFNRPYGARGGGPGCEPAVFLDGILVQDQVLDEPLLLNFNRVTPAEVAAVEVYVGPGMPLQYNSTSCGAIAIWTKRGGL